VLGARGLQVVSVQEAAGTATKSSSGAKAVKPGTGEARATRRGTTQAPTRKECLPFLEALYDLATSGLSAVRRCGCCPCASRSRGSGVSARAFGNRLGRRPAVPRDGKFSAGLRVLNHQPPAAGEATGSLNDTLARLIAI